MKYYEDKIIDSVVSNIIDTKIVRKDDTIIVALSGGMDSMCLLDVLIKLESEVGYNIIAIHVHHGIRGKEADRDLAFAKNYCKSFGIKFYSEKVNAKLYAKQKGLTLEEAARLLRYDAIDKLWNKVSRDRKNSRVYVAAAHHMNDQVETIIHNMVRGTGIKGLSGMKSKNGYIIRPLLNVRKEDIETYVKNNGISYVEDSTNSDENYTRNFIRKEIIDKYKKLNDKAIEHIADLSIMASEISEYLEMLSKFILSRMMDEYESENTKKDTIVINCKLFVASSHIIQVGVIREIFSKLTNTLKDIGKVHIDDIIDFANKEKGGHLDLPYNITVDKRQQKLIFTNNKENISMSRRKKK